MSLLGQRILTRASSQAGFTMIITIGVLLITSLLLVASFTAANGDVNISRTSVYQQQAYYAALSGVQEYEYKLEENADYWETCNPLSSAEESSERYEVSLLPAETAKGAECKTNPAEAIIESSGSASNTFRILSTGCAGKSGLTSCPAKSEGNVEVRSIVATFKVTGFLNYVYFTQYEDVDPALTGKSTSVCEKYYEEKGVKRASECETLIFTKEDSVNGPMHTDDAANVTCSKELTFGRNGHTPADPVEINGGTWPSCGSSEPTYYTESKTYSKGIELTPPESDESLGSYVESGYRYKGLTRLVLNGSSNQIAVYTWGSNTWTKKEVSWPSNGLIYVESNGACSFKYSDTENDYNGSTSKLNEMEKCGTVYVEGTYSKSLTIAATNDVIITNSIYPTSVAGKLGSAPSGTNTLGLIATNFVRVYHPTGVNESSDISEPFIYAAILSTSHSFVVDAYSSGKKLKDLNVYGAIAQKFRGPVGVVGGAGYTKEYTYDQRLVAEEPPYFLPPLKSGWKVSRETLAKAG